MDCHGVPEAQLIADTSSGNPNGRPFGYAHVEQRAQIRNELIAQGMDPDDIRTHFAVIREQDRRRAQELTMRQRQDLARWLGLKWVTPHPIDIRRVEAFTREELAAIMDRFSMANDEQGQAIADKARRMLAGLAGKP